MSNHEINEFVPLELREFAEHSVRQTMKAFDDFMSATQRAVSTFEGQAKTAHSNARELQRKVVGFSERNVAASLEFAQKLLQAANSEDIVQLHADYVQNQVRALGEQTRELGQLAAKTVAPQTPGQERKAG
jgi:phasin